MIEQLTDEHELEKRESTQVWKSTRQEDREGLKNLDPKHVNPAHLKGGCHTVTAGVIERGLICWLVGCW